MSECLHVKFTQIKSKILIS